ncbi:hypothetical protein ACFSNO_08035, partial [Streptomyces cirratus]
MSSAAEQEAVETVAGEVRVNGSVPAPPVDGRPDGHPLDRPNGLVDGATAPWPQRCQRAGRR